MLLYGDIELLFLYVQLMAHCLIILAVGPFGMNSIEIQTYSFKKNTIENIVFRMMLVLLKPDCVNLLWQSGVIELDSGEFE